MEVGGCNKEHFFYNIHFNFLLQIRGDSFLRIQIFTEIFMQFDPKSCHSVAKKLELQPIFREIILYLFKKVRHLRKYQLRKNFIFKN